MIRTQQPVSAVVLRDRRFQISPLFAPRIDPVKRFPVPTIGANCAYGIAQDGAAVVFNGSQVSGAYSWGASPVSAMFNATSLCILVSARFASAGGTLCSVWGPSSSDEQFLLSAGAGSATFGVLKDTNSRYVKSGSPTTITAGRTFRVAAYWPGGNVLKFYVDGVEVPLTTDAWVGGTVDAIGTIATTGILQLARTKEVAAGPAIEISDFALSYNFKFSDLELREYSVNPWGRFINIPNRMWVQSGWFNSIMAPSGDTPTKDIGGLIYLNKTIGGL